MVIIYTNGSHVIAMNSEDETKQIENWFTANPKDYPISEYERIEIPSGSSWSGNPSFSGHVYKN